MKKLHYDGPVVLVIMDGVGLSPKRSGNAVRQAHTEFLDYCLTNYLNIPLAASGAAVGILPGQMGNSEVGHNAIGSGQIIKQGIAGIEAAFASGDIWQSKAWQGAMKWIGVGKGAGEGYPPSGLSATNGERTKQGVPVTTGDDAAGPEKDKLRPANDKSGASQGSGSGAAEHKDSARAARSVSEGHAAADLTHKGTLHFCGIFSDGGVHSDIKHLEAMIQQAYDEGVRKIRVHCVFDGRDVAPQSEPKYIERLEKFCKKFSDADFRIASGGGRMVMTADRYENDWGMVKLGWDAMVRGVAPREFKSASEAIKTFRREDPEIQDQYLPAFVVVENAAAHSALKGRAISAQVSNAKVGQGGRAVGKIEDGDAVIYYDFRADRAVEIATAFTAQDFNKFDRGKMPEIYFAGLTEYDSDKHIPEHILVPPVQIDSPLNAFLGRNKVTELAISETVKFGHVTYYFNGNSYKKAPYEKQVEIESYTEPFNTRPWMKSAEITDVVLAELENYQFVRINYPGGDMVGHFAELEPTIVAMEAIDIQLKRLAKKVDELGGVMIVTADHGNAEELLDKGGVPKTSHSSNPVPCVFYDNTRNANFYKNAGLKDPGLANLAATIATLLGLPDYPAMWQESLIKSK